MGIAGTAVAKEASDIILMDDNFASLVKAVVWGRCVYDSIRKFLQFQLTVNISAVIITFVTAFRTTVSGDKNPESVLTAVQLLWVNLIMDTLAALALASDAPSDELLNRLPSRRTEKIINADMYRMIFAQAGYQVVVCLLIYFQGGVWFAARAIGTNLETESGVDVVTSTVVFNTFIACQVFNEVNCRSISRGFNEIYLDVNVFQGIQKNSVFLIIILVTMSAQFLIIQFGSIVFSVDPNGLDWIGWVTSVCFGFGTLIVGFLVRTLPPFPIPEFLTKDNTPIPKINIEPVIIQVDESQGPGNTTTSRWDMALKSTTMQVKVIKAFQAPTSEKLPAARPLDDQKATLPGSKPSAWHRLRDHVIFSGSYARRTSDTSRMIDPRALYAARLNRARGNMTEGIRKISTQGSDRPPI